MKCLVIIPTYNESENIKKIIKTVLKQPVKNLDILVIDDNSQDGTANIVKSLAKNDKRVQLIERPGKLGLGTAYKLGFKYALERNYNFIFEMDADFSHNPEDIPRFIEAIKSCDLVIGSRYIKGGRILNWPSSRRILSFLANKFAKYLTGVPVNDMTAGYKCYRRCVVEKYDFNKLRANGYGFQIETVFFAYKNKFRIKEIPITFQDRIEGSSKMSRKIIYEAFFRVLKLAIFERFFTS